MTGTEKILLGGALLAVAVIFSGRSYETILKKFLPSVEGFSSSPYWDNKQWSWGYGTRVPGSVDNRSIRPSGTITPATAMDELLKHSRQDYAYLHPLVNVKLSNDQWAAYLSFAYNEGPGNADNLLTNLNSQDWAALENQWKKYIYANGVVDTDLIDRRDKEWNLFAG